MSEAILSIAASCALLIVSQLSPGPDIFYVLRTALARGYRAAVAVATGINIGFCIQAIIVCTVGTRIAEQSWSYWVLAAAGLWMLHLARCIMPPDRIRRHRLNRDNNGRGNAGGKIRADGSVNKNPPTDATFPTNAEAAFPGNSGNHLSAPIPGETATGSESDIPESLPRLLLRGFLCNILNVKCMLFIAGLSISAVTRYSPQYAWFTPALIIAMLLAAQSGWMLWSGLMQLPTLRRLYAKGSFAIDAAFALLLCLFGLALLIPLAEAGLKLIF